MIGQRLAACLASGSLSLVLAACAGVQPVAYSGIEASHQLRPNFGDDRAKIPFAYATPVVWSRYTQVVLEPVSVYQGTDAQFGDMKDEDKSALASYAQKAFAESLGKRFQLGSQTGPGVLRVKITLTGAERTTPLVGQAMHFDIAGNLYNGVQAVRGGQGAFSGSVSYAVEVYDGSDGRLLKAYVAKQYPNAMNLPAAFGSLGAAKTGLDKGAQALVAQLH
ncbi:DUF3313 domain-containing protein [Paraburkholderia sp. Ac-20340]|uniref:DUF3313 domain-containing protein n=1 Tax=Paraburkholderia sp. Ac-20340 TaxID=2703888 RepID=UPI00197F0774|nr:DUF3313 domain-containing protein [Paraburkholderia sp. Ac-20340]MBN3853663.1 DUF3313 domain-containing protein [Paraburkholderia sp. Ac-20340]